MKQLLLIECYSIGSVLLTHLEGLKHTISMDDIDYESIVDELKNSDIRWVATTSRSEKFPDIEDKYKYNLISMITNKEYPIYLNSQEEIDSVETLDSSLYTFITIRRCEDLNYDILPKQVRDTLNLNKARLDAKCAAMYLNR
jgi:hypothetical protein